LDLIRSGRASAVMVSAAAMELSPIWLQGWTLINAISFRSFNDEPTRASRPFDKRREGFVPSEGAGVVVLESLASARERGACIHAELLGASSTSNASRLTKPGLDGQSRAMFCALQDARVEPEQVDYINAHATSTPLGDASEVAAIKKVFGSHAYQIPINSTKSILGHCLTASSMVEMITTILQMKHSLVHPTINLEDPDPELDLDFVPHQAREHAIDIALSNSFGFGGLNSSIVVGTVI
ncbi:MAG: beta-ketoacyl-[acyl-carrier-protein] synthase family protein, partial [Cyanobacteria bacterium P01_F01_bin.116]